MFVHTFPCSARGAIGPPWSISSGSKTPTLALGLVGAIVSGLVASGSKRQKTATKDNPALPNAETPAQQVTIGLAVLKSCVALARPGARLPCSLRLVSVRRQHVALGQFHLPPSGRRAPDALMAQTPPSRYSGCAEELQFERGKASDPLRLVIRVIGPVKSWRARFFAGF